MVTTISTYRRSCDEPVTAHLIRTRLGDGAGAFFTGRDLDSPAPGVGAAGNLSHRRPHRPSDLARARSEVAEAIGVPTEAWCLMHQVHGDRVGVVDGATPPGAEVRGVDAIVTREQGRALVVQVADCVPVLLAGRTAVAAVHAGREGVSRGVLDRTLDRLEALGEAAVDVDAVIGPAIGGCCYEVPEHMRDELAARLPEAGSTTRWGSPSLDLPAAVEAQLAAAGVERVERLGICTLEDERFFSHRRDPASGRQVGIVWRDREAA
jgi:polyphenol oxidase